jgi:hypothetical protein
MKDLKNVLSRYTAPASAPSAPLGADETTETARASALPVSIDREALRKDLAAVRDDNKRWFALCGTMVLLLFVVSVVVTVMHIDQPGTIKTVLSAFGISSAGLILMMFRFWRTKSSTEMLVILAVNMDAEAMRTVITILAKKL